MKLFSIISLFMISFTIAAKEKANVSAGIAFDMGTGITVQYNGFSFFASGDALAIDKRFQNFYNDNKTLHFYLDIGAFLEDYDGNDADRDDRVGIRVPVGLTFGIEKNLSAYVQAVPNIDFANDSDFEIDGAIGIRYRF